MSMRDGRPTFYYDDDNDNEIRAGGLLLYRYDECTCEPEFLMIKTKRTYEDFGGRTDISDKTINDTICREAEEESNGILKINEVYDLIKNQQPIYSRESKYLLYIVKTDISYNPDDFGKFEIHDGIRRTVQWIKLSKLLNKNFHKSIHIRLKFKSFFDQLAQLRPPKQ